jgi:hypothetical protein
MTQETEMTELEIEDGDFGYEETKADHEDGYDSNGPTLKTLSNAIQCWALQNDCARYADNRKHRGMTVQEAALAFAVPVERVLAAVEWHYWMFLEGEGATATIMHEGE